MGESRRSAGLEAQEPSSASLFSEDPLKDLPSLCLPSSSSGSSSPCFSLSFPPSLLPSLSPLSLSPTFLHSFHAWSLDLILSPLSLPPIYPSIHPCILLPSLLLSFLNERIQHPLCPTHSSRLHCCVKGHGRVEMTTLELWDITFASCFLASTSLPVRPE